MNHFLLSVTFVQNLLDNLKIVLKKLGNYEFQKFMPFISYLDKYIISYQNGSTKSWFNSKHDKGQAYKQVSGHGKVQVQHGRLAGVHDILVHMVLHCMKHQLYNHRKRQQCILQFGYDNQEEQHDIRH